MDGIDMGIIIRISETGNRAVFLSGSPRTANGQSIDRRRFDEPNVDFGRARHPRSG